MAQGRKCKIEFAKNSNGKKPAEDFLLSLDERQKIKFRALFHKLLESEDGRINNIQKFKKLQGCDIWEFISKPNRVLCFMHQNTWYLTNGFKKKSNSTRRKYIEIAEAIKKEFIDNL